MYNAFIFQSEGLPPLPAVQSVREAPAATRDHDDWIDNLTTSQPTPSPDTDAGDDDGLPDTGIWDLDGDKDRGDRIVPSVSDFDLG